MDNSKYVFEMKENVPVRTSDASKGHEVVVYAEQVLKEMGKNNSTGKYDKVVQGVRSLLGQSLLDGDKLKNAVRQEVERLLKKYNPNDAKPLHEMNTNELRDLAVSLGADKNKLYGTSKQALIIIIDKLKREKSNDAAPPVKGNYFMRGDKITYEGKKGVVKNAYGDVVVVQLEGDPKGDYRHLSYYTVKYARDMRTVDADYLPAYVYEVLFYRDKKDYKAGATSETVFVKNKSESEAKNACFKKHGRNIEIISVKYVGEGSTKAYDSIGNMKTVDEVVTVNESDFVSSHAKNPKGYGHWIFGIGSKNMSDWFETTGTYAESKKRAIEEAKKKGKTTIYTMG